MENTPELRSSSREHCHRIRDTDQLRIRVSVIIPRHSSILPKILQQPLIKDPSHINPYDHDDLKIVLRCYQPAVLWYGIMPIMVPTRSSTTRSVPRRLLYLLFENSIQDPCLNFESTMERLFRQGSGHLWLKCHLEDQRNGSSNSLSRHHELCNVDLENVYHRDVDLTLPPAYVHWLKKKVQFSSKITRKIVLAPLVIFPSPIKAHLDTSSSFMNVFLQNERNMLKKQSLAALMATLGGGYFFIKRLNKSLELARQQRLLAIQIGNDGMARQCLLNEAYNLIYAGRFQEAKMALKRLENEVTKSSNRISDHDAYKLNSVVVNGEEENRILRQCHAARIFARRLQKLAPRLTKYHTNATGENHTMDDYQRVRIVEQS